MISSLKFSPLEASLHPNYSIKAQLANMLLQIKQGESSPKTIGKFLEAITGVVRKLEQEQEEHKKISTKMMEQCTAEETLRGNEIKAAEEAYGKAQSEQKKCDDSLKSAKKDLPDLEKARDSYDAQLRSAIDTREKEHAAYLLRKADYENAIVFLKDFIGFVKSKLSSQFTSFAFVQHSETLLRHASKLGLIKEAVPILVAIAQAPAFDVPTVQNEYKYTPAQDIGEKLRKTLDGLLTKLETDEKDNNDAEFNANNAFIKLKGELEGALKTLGENIDKTNTQITNMKNCYDTEGAVLAKASSKLLRNTELKESAAGMCGDFAKEFTDATKSREEEVKTIKEILTIIESRFGKIPIDIKSYLDNVETGWKNYENSTEFKKFVAYEQQQIANNLAGQKLLGDHAAAEEATKNVLP